MVFRKRIRKFKKYGFRRRRSFKKYGKMRFRKMRFRKRRFFKGNFHRSVKNVIRNMSETKTVKLPPGTLSIIFSYNNIRLSAI